MNYENKYKEALDWMRSLYDSLEGSTKEDAEHFFPELKEDEDERIRKEIINFVKSRLAGFPKCEKYINWLEKQDKLEKPTRNQVWDYCSKISHEWWQIAMAKLNTLTDEEKSKYNQFIGFNDFSDTLMNITAGALFQLIDTGKLEYEEGSLLLEKPDDTPMPIETTNPIDEQDSQILANIEPKFKVGDWVVNKLGTAWHIDSFDKKNYQVSDEKGNNNYFKISNQDEMRLWTTKDAKAGDVLVWDYSKCIALFKNICDEESLNSYGFVEHGMFLSESEKCEIYHYSINDAHPATKEQCDLLFQKMKEAGYEWDAKNKKLIKINSQQTEVKDTTKLITAELLEKNGFEFSHERCEGFECYSLIKFKGNVDIDLMHYENPNTDWLLTIMFNDCEKVLIKVISTVDELQQCLDIMGIELKIKI